MERVASLNILHQYAHRMTVLNTSKSPRRLSSIKCHQLIPQGSQWTYRIKTWEVVRPNRVLCLHYTLMASAHQSSLPNLHGPTSPCLKVLTKIHLGIKCQWHPLLSKTVLMIIRVILSSNLHADRHHKCSIRLSKNSVTPSLFLISLTKKELSYQIVTIACFKWREQRMKRLKSSSRRPSLTTLKSGSNCSVTQILICTNAVKVSTDIKLLSAQKT